MATNLIPRVLIVDDLEDIRWLLQMIVEKAGMQPLVARDGISALEIIRQHPVDVMLLDAYLPGLSGNEVLIRVREIDDRLPIIMITAFSDVKEAVSLVKAGAYDYLPKPFSNDEVVRTIRRALDEAQSRRAPQEMAALEIAASLEEKMGQGSKIKDLAAEIARVAPTEMSVLVTGETGVGKEIVAREVHNQSLRRENKFLAVDCGAITETLIESELFGYEKGAFTGADRSKEGKFEAAANGTLFFDEISNLPRRLQGVLLRTLQERKFYRVGGNVEIDATCRLLSASNRELYSGSGRHQRLRQDLYHRISEYSIHVPPLRERKEDIIHLAKRFVNHANRELGRRVQGISPAALDKMFDYKWPGNVRELRNVIRKGVLLAREVIEPEHLDLLPLDGSSAPSLPFPQPTNGSRLPLREIVRRSTTALEKEVIHKTLLETGGNKAKAARILEIDYKTIHTKIKELGIITDQEAII